MLSKQIGAAPKWTGSYLLHHLNEFLWNLTCSFLGGGGLPFTLALVQEAVVNWSIGKWKTKDNQTCEYLKWEIIHTLSFWSNLQSKKLLLLCKYGLDQITLYSYFFSSNESCSLFCILSSMHRASCFCLHSVSLCSEPQSKGGTKFLSKWLTVCHLCTESIWVPTVHLQNFTGV